MKNAFDVASDFYSLDYLAKCPCIAMSSKEYTSEACKAVILKPLAFHIGDKALWKEDNDIVSMGSQTYDILECEEVQGSTNDILFANNGIRHVTFAYMYKGSTNLHSALELLTTALNCKKYCNLAHILENACIRVCLHSLIYSGYQKYKREKQSLNKIIPFWILNSGILLHFTGEKKDFIVFEKLLIPFPIYTANSLIYITEKESVTLKHLNIKYYEETTTIYSVFFCEDLTY